MRASVALGLGAAAALTLACGRRATPAGDGARAVALGGPSDSLIAVNRSQEKGFAYCFAG